jgi:hypothetical protein
MLKKFITGLSTIMPFLTSYPMWVRIIVVVWVCLTIVLILSLLLFRAPQKENLEAATLPHKTPLYEKTKQKIEDFYIDIDRNKLTPWSFLRTGKMREIKDYYDRSIRYQGVEFEGSPRIVFWEGFIEPFLEHGIIDILEQVSEEAQRKNLDPEACINEAVSLLYGRISKVYSRMAEIDQKLRGKGYPNKVKRRDVSQRIKKMHDYLREQQNAITEIAKSQSIQAPKEKFRQSNTFKFVVIPLLGIIVMSIVGIPAWISLFRKAGQHSIVDTNIFADVSKEGVVLRSNNFPWEIRKSNDQVGNILYTIVDRRGDATAVLVIPDNPKYTVYQSYDGMVIKFTCSEKEISNFTIKLKY